MKKNEDYKIQVFLDKQMTGVESKAIETMDADDLETYELIYHHLKEKPGQRLPLTFETNVLRQIKIEKERASDTRF